MKFLAALFIGALSMTSSDARELQWKPPTDKPTATPTYFPTETPTFFPTKIPTYSPTNSPTKFPTPYPTESPTDSPTESPTEKPTKAPTPLPTVSPTKNPTKAPTPLPTVFPTSSPTPCINPDDLCPCGKQRSRKVDVIFVNDESGSVGPANFNLVRQAIRNFVTGVDPPFDPVDGARVGYLEYSTFVNDIISLDEFQSEADFLSVYDSFIFNSGGTSTGPAMEAAVNMARNVPRRPDSSLAIVLLSDGISGTNGVAALKQLRAEQEYKLFFLPIGGSLATNFLDGVLISDGVGQALTPEEFEVHPAPNFAVLDDLLNSEDRIIEFGECINIV